MKRASHIILNGEFIKETEAKISPLNRGMMYGDGCFETLRSYKGKFLDFDKHFDRLSGGFRYLNIENSLINEGIKENILELLDQNELLNTDSLIRIQGWREGDRGYKTSSSKMSWMIQASELKTSDNPLKLSVVETRCIPSAALERRFKLSNGLNFIKAAQEAKAANKDDALMLTINNIISETTSANIFWIHDDTVFTPSEECDILPGITRKFIIQILRAKDIKLEIGKFSINHLKTAHAAFCCNSIREIQEVESLDGSSYETGHPLVKKIMIQFETNKQQLLKL